MNLFESNLNYTLIIFLSIFTIILSYYSNLYFTKFLNRKNLLDLPNHRSSHKIPTPRGGGIPLILSFIFVYIISSFFEINIFDIHFFIGLILIFLLGVIEDFKPMPVKIRLLIQILIAIYIIHFNQPFQNFPFPEPLNFQLNYYLAFILNVVWIVGVINIYNWLDGIDAFAAIQGLIVCISIFLIGFNLSSEYISLILFFAILGFLFHNWPPAKIFMGDAGAYSLGYIFAVLPFYAFENSAIGVFSISILLWFFLSDSLFTIIRRLINKEKIFEAHRSHLYQRLNIMGWEHKKINYFLFPFMSLLALLQIINSYFNFTYNLQILIVAVLLFLIYLSIVLKIEKNR